MNRFILLILLFSFALADCLAEDRDSLRIAGVRAEMDSLCIREPAFTESVDISVGQMRLSELLRTIANLKEVNLSVRDDFDCVVSCSFTSSRIDDLIVFLCREYGLDIDIYGNIVSIFKYSAPVVPIPPLDIEYEASDSLMSFSFSDRTLSEVTGCIMTRTGENIIISNDLRNLEVSAMAIRVSLTDALEIIAEGNGLDAFPVQGRKKIWCLARKVESMPPPRRRRDEGYRESIDTTVVLPLHYRSVGNIQDLIPEAMKKDVALLTSDEMNSLIIHGKKTYTDAVKDYVSSIDVTIPLVSIDVMIVETSRRFSRNVGLKAGRTSSSVETSATIGQGVDVVLGSAEVSSLLQKIDGFSNVNLGNVADNLYLELKLLENRGDVKLESTPKLATLNGHKASMSKGETIYYKEINTSYLGSQNPLQTSSYNWKSVDADLTIDITPHVSLDSLVTLEVDLSQSEFGTIKEENAPPPITKRSFKSIVRVADGDVVLLGGLDSALDSDSRDGLPWIARVPVLRWIFGSHRREKEDSRMSIFIRAEIVD
jgi:type IV pilus assembly protein PilQ